MEDSESIDTFANWVKSILKKPQDDKPRDQEQLYQDQIHNLPNGPKTAKLPPMEDLLAKDLLTTLDFNPKLNSDQKSRLEKVILENTRAFSIDGRIGRYEGIQYPIHLKEDAQLVSLAPYHTSPEKREAIDKQLDKWFSQDIIGELDSPWGAPVIVVYCNGKPWVCVDYRRVNDFSQADEYPLPKQTDILRALSGSQWLSTFDALSGFQQVEVVPKHRHITAFRTHWGLLEFSQLPFGLRNRLAVFQRIMNKVLAKFLWLFILVYIDDIVVYSLSFENHLSHLGSILKAISQRLGVTIPGVNKLGIIREKTICNVGYT